MTPIPPTERERPACTKGTRKSPCVGPVSVIQCGGCSKTYARCEGHGGVAGSRRSRNSHWTLVHDERF